MALKRGGGHTLIELIIYFALSIAALGILASLFTVARRTGDQTYAQYLVAGNMATTIRMIRKELQATSLASVTSYGVTAGQAPGFSCVSAYDDKGEFQLGAYGTPHWQKHVYYTLNSEGAITRWTTDITDKNYLPTLAPDPTPDSGGKVLMHDALPPNTAVGTWQAATTFGGLEVGFVRRNGGAETVSFENPRDSKTPAQNTRLIEVILRTLEEAGPNFMEIKFRVAPRY
jgi:type II secretory pathway pseudopilin PulG